MKKIILFGQSLILCSWLAWSCAPAERVSPVPAASRASNLESVARGGLLYDMWWRVVPGASEPKSDQALWSLQTTNKRSGSVSWRCKECHGWDYKGKDGAYGSGSRFTGFSGVWDAAQNKSAEQLAASLRGATNDKHNFSSVLRPGDIADLVNFLKSGLLDMGKHVDYKTRQPIGADVGRGKSLYALCGACHGADGKSLNFGTEKSPEYIGTIARANPQEFLHKTWVGHPGSNPAMPAALVIGWSTNQMVDVLAYAQTLPEK